MRVDAALAAPEFDIEATDQLVASGPTTIDGADFVIGELRRLGGRFDLAGRRFDEPQAMLAYACSGEFADAWRAG